MRFLITGGAGFIGAALAQALLTAGHEVRVLDDLSSGDRDCLPAAVHFTRGDVNNVPLLWTMLQDVDCVYHLAARVSVAQSILYPGEYNQVNVGGTVSLLEAIRDAGVGRVVLASSGAVYGLQSSQPLSERTMPQPDSPYAVSKLSAEHYLQAIGAQWSIETVALRIFNAYGPRQSLPVSHAPVVPRFLQQALTGGSVVIYGDGEQTRDFIFVDDVVRALTLAATAPAIDQQVINVGSGVETSMNELVAQVAEATGRSVNVIHNSEKRGGVRRLVADVAEARRLLDFTPQVDLLTGLRRTIAADPRFQLEKAPAAAH